MPPTIRLLQRCFSPEMRSEGESWEVAGQYLLDLFIALKLLSQVREHTTKCSVTLKKYTIDGTDVRHTVWTHIGMLVILVGTSSKKGVFIRASYQHTRKEVADKTGTYSLLKTPARRLLEAPRVDNARVVELFVILITLFAIHWSESGANYWTRSQTMPSGWWHSWLARVTRRDRLRELILDVNSHEIWNLDLHNSKRRHKYTRWRSRIEQIHWGWTKNLYTRVNKPKYSSQITSAFWAKSFWGIILILASM